jgi:hypothetical protein
LDFGICHLGYKEAEANSSPKSRGNPGFREIQIGDGGPRGGEAPRGALRGGLGCKQGRQTEIDDHQRAALSCCVTGLPLCWGGPVRAGPGAAFGRRAA